ncbi:MAG: MerR family DNA-binding transcriptional regulator [Bdellovibrionaceae bacterium]|nr:MerR family DNA-binding transcriptional regulator [Pseudobdellovibrionaceae bacterium]
MAKEGRTGTVNLSVIKGKWLTVAELAKELLVHPDTIRRWNKKGLIKSVRHPFNNFRLFQLSDLLGEADKNETGYSSYLRTRLIERAGEGGVLNSSPEEVPE